MSKATKFVLLVLGTAIFAGGYFFLDDKSIKLLVCGVGVVLFCYAFYKLLSNDKKDDTEDTTENNNEMAMTEEELTEFLTKDGEYDYDSSDDKFCDDCGAVRKPGWYYCPECGYCYDKLDVCCEMCNEEIHENWKYCVACGNKLFDEDVDTEYTEADFDRPCPICGQLYMPDWNFCATCGFDLKKPHNSCPSCGTPIEEEWDYCSKCGELINKE